MRINHHNYEEYFILYMDNELTADDRRMVEAFVQQYPELNDELQLLLQYKLTPDTSVVFNGKEELMKMDGETPVSLSNYEEWMVLYHDNELTETQKRSVELLMIGNPGLKEEFEQLKKAKLEPEKIVFSHKASIYRKEEKRRPIPWFRIAAAAILLLAITTTAIVVINNKDTKTPGDTFAKETIRPVIKTADHGLKSDPALANKENIVNEQENNKVLPVVTPSNKNKKNDLSVNDSKRDDIAVDPKLNAVRNDAIANVPEPEPDDAEPMIAVVKSNNLPSPNSNRKIIDDSDVKSDVAKHISPLTSPVVTTSYTEPSDTDDGKNTNRGLFRKIARTFEKRAGIDPTDDNRLLVAGLAIRLK